MAIYSTHGKTGETQRNERKRQSPKALPLLVFSRYNWLREARGNRENRDSLIPQFPRYRFRFHFLPCRGEAAGNIDTGCLGKDGHKTSPSPHGRGVTVIIPRDHQDMFAAILLQGFCSQNAT